MRSPADERVYISLRDLKVNIKSVKNLKRDITEQIIDHLYVSIALQDVFGCIWTYLNSSWVEGSILILEWGDEDDVLEPVKAILFRELKKCCFLKLFMISHWKLLET